MRILQRFVNFLAKASQIISSLSRHSIPNWPLTANDCHIFFGKFSLLIDMLCPRFIINRLSQIRRLWCRFSHTSCPSSTWPPQWAAAQHISYFFGQLVAWNIHHLTKTAVALSRTPLHGRWSSVASIWSTVTYPNCVNREQWHRMIYLRGSLGVWNLGFVPQKRITMG